jgi:hypothetical protein
MEDKPIVPDNYLSDLQLLTAGEAARLLLIGESTVYK